MKVARRFATLPLEFEKNEGQFNRKVAFAARGKGYSAFLTSDGATIYLRSQKSEIRSQKQKSHHRAAISRQVQERPDVVHLRLIASNPAAKIFGLDEQSGKANYIIGKDPSQWRTNVPLYGRVEYSSVYPGIDLVYHGNQRRLEFDFALLPGADARAIRLRMEDRKSTSEKRRAKFEKRKAAAGMERSSAPGVEPKISITKNGELVIGTPRGDVRFLKPIAYQPVDGSGPAPDSEFRIHNSKLVRARFVLLPNDEVGLRLGKYDRSKPLVIDPVLEYSTYYGGTGMDVATSIAVDSAGNAYIAGYTTSSDLPTASLVQSSYGGGACNSDLSPSPCFDAFVAKLNAQGTALIYATYLGGSGDDRATGIAVDSGGEAFVTGYTGSANFPVANAFQGALGGGTCGSTTNPYPCYDAFVAKLSASGSSLVYSTYLGGAGDDYATGIAIDPSLDAYVTGFTSGGNFPVTSGAMQPSFGGGSYDAFVAKLGPAGSTLLYSTFLGGSAEDRAAAIAVDSYGDAYIAGQTDSTNFPAVNAFQPSYAGGACRCFDAFVTKLNPSGSAAIYSTYLGGTGGDYGNAIAVDSGGHAFVAGWTTSTDFPVTSGAYQRAYGGSDDAFVTKLDAAGSALVYSTYLGGIDPEVANGIALDASGDALIAGSAYGAGFPALNPIQAANGGFYDAFVAAFNSAGAGLLYATWLGGSGDDFGNAIAADASGNAFVAGATFSTDFPTTPGSLATAYTGGAYDAFVAKIALGGAAGISVTPDPVTFGNQALGTTSAPKQVTITNNGTANLDVAGIAVSGDFSESGNCASVIEPGQSCAVSVSFEPAALGASTGTITFTDNASSSPQTVVLSGVGAAPFTISAGSGVVSVLRGTNEASSVISATSDAGFDSLISLGCSAAGSQTCTFSPPSIKPGGSSTLTVSNLSGLAADSLSLTVMGTSGAETSSVNLVINFEDFALAVSPVSISLSAGGTASYQLTVTPVNGFNLPVSMSCSGAPSEAACSVSPSNLTLNGTSASTIVFSVTTTASGDAPPILPYFPFPGMPAIGILALAFLARIRRPVSRARLGPRHSLAALALAMALSACGGGGGGATAPAHAPQGTPAGTYTITLQASAGSLSHSTAVTLVVR